LRGRKLFAVAGAVAALSLGAAACGDDSSSSSGGGGESLDLVIGASLPLSGALADYGPPGEKAANLAVDQINAAAKEAGADHSVELVSEDNGGGDDPQAAVQAARKLVSSDGASCLAGAWASSDTIPTAESVTIPEEVPLISPSSTSDEITDLDDNGLVFRTPPADINQGPTLADAVAEDLGGAEGMTVNIAGRNDSYGKGLATVFRDAWEGQGGTIGEEVLYDPKLPSYDTEADQITGNDPDAIVIFDFPETYAKVGPALVRTGNFDTSIAWVTDGLKSSELADAAGADAVDGMRGTAPGSPDAGDASEAFDKLYNSSDPADVKRQTFDSQNFDAVMLCYLAAVAAGSTDGADIAEHIQDVSGPGGDKYTFEQLPEAIKALQNGDDIDYEGASGPIDLDDNGDPTAGVYDIFEFKNGVDKVVDEVPVATTGG
jgi:ABC-type branched-subunit amino acid transport system substrate-binding protein